MVGQSPSVQTMQKVVLDAVWVWRALPRTQLRRRVVSVVLGTNEQIDAPTIAHRTVHLRVANADPVTQHPGALLQVNNPHVVPRNDVEQGRIWADEGGVNINARNSQLVTDWFGISFNQTVSCLGFIDVELRSLDEVHLLVPAKHSVQLPMQGRPTRVQGKGVPTLSLLVYPEVPIISEGVDPPQFILVELIEGSVAAEVEDFPVNGGVLAPVASAFTLHEVIPDVLRVSRRNFPCAGVETSEGCSFEAVISVNPSHHG